MRIKHFAGYGCVTAKKIKEYKHNDYTVLEIEVSGNHEYGLTRSFYDPYGIANWLKGFIKGRELKDYVVPVNDYKKVNGLDVEYALYKLYLE